MFFNDPEIKYYRETEYWYETDSDCIEKIIALEFKDMRKQLNKDENWEEYITNPNRFMSKDHMEFFIKKA